MDLGAVALERAVALEETTTYGSVSAALWLLTGSFPGRAVALERAVALRRAAALEIAFDLEARVVAVASEASRQFFE